MATRIILYTGKGGVGKTSVAAASALEIARAGHRTVVLSTDPAHSLSDSLGAKLGAEPTPVTENLFGQEIQAQRELERNWKAVQQWLVGFLTDRGLSQISAAELTVPPGMDELFSLLQIKAHEQSGQWDVIVVDCAPTGETLRLLSFPDVARWWLERVFPWEKRMVAAARPLAKGLFNLNLPSEDVFDDVKRLVENLVAMNEILRDSERTSIRLVMNPDRMVIKEAQRTFTYLNLYGFLTDAVVLNRIFPAELDGGYFGEWRQTHSRNCELVESAFSPLPLLKAPFYEREVIGQEMLGRLASDLFAECRPEERLHSGLSQKLSVDNGRASLELAVPFVEKADIELKKAGLELIVRVDGQKRNIMLPNSLTDYRPVGARFEDGSLQISFEK